VAHPFDGVGHRDHSWGGERDWAKFHRWTYLSGEFGADFWFNAVRIDLGDQLDIRIGCLWDGRELHALQQLEIEPRTVEGGSRQTGVDARLTDEHGREHRIASEEVLVNCPVWMGRTALKDAIVRYRYGERTGYGIHEHGYVETAPRDSVSGRDGERERGSVNGAEVGPRRAEPARQAFRSATRRWGDFTARGGRFFLTNERLFSYTRRCDDHGCRRRPARPGSLRGPRPAARRLP